ncbi:phospholipase-like protein [Tanacetum coccineum]
MMNDPNITMEECIRLEEEKAQKRRKVFNWETAKYGRIWYDEDVHDHRSIKNEFLAITFNNRFESQDDWEVDRYGNANLVITKYLVNISKRCAFWSLNKDILKIVILTTNTPYPSRKIRRIRACTHQRSQRNEDQYAISKEDQYTVLDIWHVNILEDIKRGPYSKKLQYALLRDGWIDFPPGTVDSWDLLKKAFIQRYCPPSRTAKQLEEIRNFKQEGDETLYQAWEWYNDLLYKCPTHDINNHQKTMAAHSQKWHDGSSNRSIEGSSSEGIASIVNKLENLGRDMKKLKENIHAIQVGCQNYRGAHLDKDCPLKEEKINGAELSFPEFLLVKYGENQEKGLVWDERFKEWCINNPNTPTSRNTKDQENLNPRPKDYPFKDWLLTKVGHTNVMKDPRERSFDDYKWMFDVEIDQLADEYELGIGKKGHILEDIWENCRKVQGDNTYWWHDQKSEKEERYSFDTGQSFICVTKELMDALPMGRENRSRFRDMIRKEVDSGRRIHR